MRERVATRVRARGEARRGEARRGQGPRANGAAGEGNTLASCGPNGDP